MVIVCLACCGSRQGGKSAASAKKEKLPLNLVQPTTSTAMEAEFDEAEFDF
jgi:hypothetical protein